MRRGIWRYFDLGYAPCEWFTDRARLVMALAEVFAAEQGSLFIEPEHVLRGLASGPRGVGRMVLERLGVELLSLLPGIAASLPALGGGFLPDHTFGPRAEMLCSAARDSATELAHRYVGTEHLLLGLLRTPGPASAFLQERGVTYEKALRAVIEMLGVGVDDASAGGPRWGATRQ